MRDINRQTSGFSLVEALTVISIIGTMAAISIMGVIREMRQARISGAANELAAWLVAVRRSAERGIPCKISIPNQTPVGTESVATSLAINPDNSSNTTIPNNCLQEFPLRFQSSQGQSIYLSVASNANQFFFSPRGTIHQDGSPVNPIDISIRTYENGASTNPTKHVCIYSPLGLIRVSNSCEG